MQDKIILIESEDYDMNLANKLTLLRIILIPFYLLFMLVEITHYHFWIATAIFFITAATDWFDGRIARKRNMVTDFGKFADPLADKLLVLSAMICFVQIGMMPAWVCIIIMAREIIISGFRLVCAGKGTVVAASMPGKIKTVTQMAFVIITSFQFSYYFGEQIPAFCQVVETCRIIIMYVALVMTIYSLVDYFIRNKDALDLKNI